MLSPDEVVRALFQAPFLIQIVSRDGVLASSNYALGLSREELLGRPAEESVVPEDREAYNLAFRSALYSREVGRFAVRLRTAEAPGELAVAGEQTAVVGPDGRPSHVLCVCFEAGGLVRIAQAAEAKGEPNAPGEWFSHLGARIYANLADGQWKNTERIARELGENPTGDVRAVLREYADRRILESGQRGFRRA